MQKEHSDNSVNAILRAFWRRINRYKNNYDAELPDILPVELEASMRTALSAIDVFGLTTAKQAIFNILFTSADSDEPLGIVSNITDNKDGSYSFVVADAQEFVKYKHTIRTEQI